MSELAVRVCHIGGAGSTSELGVDSSPGFFEFSLE
jgi:hypothetical protein